MTDRARKLAETLVSRWEHGDEAHRQWLRDVAIPDVAVALSAAFREGGEAIRREAVAAPTFMENSHGTPERRGFLRGVEAKETAIRALPPVSDVDTPPDPLKMALARTFRDQWDGSVGRVLDKAVENFITLGLVEKAPNGFLSLTDLGREAIKAAGEG